MYVLVLGLFRLEVGVGVGVEGGYGYRQKQRQIMNRCIVELKRTELGRVEQMCAVVGVESLDQKGIGFEEGAGMEGERYLFGRQTCKPWSIHAG